MADLNTVSLVGNVTRDPEISSGDDWTVARFGLAVEGFKRAAAIENDVHFFSVACWGKQAELAERNVHKGRRLAINGRLEQNRWETDEGDKRSTVEVVATDIYFIGPRKDGSEPAAA